MRISENIKAGERKAIQSFRPFDFAPGCTPAVARLPQRASSPGTPFRAVRVCDPGLDGTRKRVPFRVGGRAKAEVLAYLEA